ncbi:hypothetical protein ACSBR2_024016 [Camellia fascicularis]
MAHHTTHRRNLAALDPPKTSMDPTHKKQPKSNSTTTTTTTTTKPKHPTDLDPTIASSTTIHNISKQFSKLYTNHQRNLKRPNPPSKPQIDNTHFQAKPMSVSAIEDTSTKPTCKSNYPNRKTVAEIEKDKLRVAITGVKVKKSSKKERAKKEFHEEHDTKRPSVSLSKSHDSGLKIAHEGDDLKKPPFSLAVSGGMRRSFCNSQAELADFFSCSGVKVVSVDMPPFMQVHAVDCARKTHDSLEKFTSKTLAFTLKKEFDGVYGPAWHCIVGTSFGSFVTHSVGFLESSKALADAVVGFLCQLVLWFE